MMKCILSLACAALLTTGLQAQISGSINRGAPTVTNAIEMGDNKLELKYTSIRFGEGQWQQILENEDRHERFNKAAENRPIGSVKTTCNLTAAGKDIPAGSYSMFFSVHPQAGWILNLKPEKGEAIRWRLALKDSDKKCDCMKISLEPAAENGKCALTIAFGKQMVSVPVMVAANAKPAGR